MAADVQPVSSCLRRYKKSFENGKHIKSSNNQLP